MAGIHDLASLKDEIQQYCINKASNGCYLFHFDGTLTSINMVYSHCEKQRTYFGFNQNSSFLQRKKSNPSLSITNNKGCTPLCPK
jgi:hypothetical protein